MISVIIPAYNDEGFIKSTIASLKENAYTRLLKEIIVVDAGSTDKTLQEARDAGAVILRSIRKNRSVLMNLGADFATGDILYFITPGTIAPANYCNEIVRTIQKKNFLGSFALKVKSHWIVKSLAKFTDFQKKYSRLEDQSLFVDRELFVKAGKFREDLKIMEDHDLISRLRRYTNFEVVAAPIENVFQTLAKHNFRTELSYMVAFWMYDNGYSNEKISRLYNAVVSRKRVSRPEPQTELSASFN